MQTPILPRRRFLQASIAAAGAIPLGCVVSQTSAKSSATPASLKGRIYKSLKFGMIGVKGSLTEKFRAAKEAGFMGVEMDSPGVDVAEALKARDETGLFIDGTVCSTHWKIRLSDPDPDVRKQGLENLLTAIRDTHAMGGHTVLLVPGAVRDAQSENQQQAWDRSIEQIVQAIPLAAELGVWIAIENVWNGFNYIHEGPSDQTAELFVKYVDAINSPWVGMQFDIGNHQKYGKPALWIRQLGKRIVKLDVKDWSTRDNFSKIGQGDVNWADVRKALLEIGYVGWAAAEVQGGGPDVLRDVSQRMDKVFEL